MGLTGSLYILNNSAGISTNSSNFNELISNFSLASKESLAVKQKIRHAACGVAQMFAVSAEHFAFLAQMSLIHEIAIDLVTGNISPSEFQIERNRIHSDRCVEYFKKRMGEIQGFSYKDAKLTVRFSEYKGFGRNCVCNAEFLVTIIDVDGREWHGEFYTPKQIVVG